MNLLAQYMKGRNLSILKTGVMNLLKNNANKVSPPRNPKEEVPKGKRDSKSKNEVKKEEPRAELTNKISTNSNPGFRTSMVIPSNIHMEKEEVQMLSDFEKLLNSLVEQDDISRNQAKFVCERFVRNDEFILSTWEIYQYNKNIEEFIENIRISSSKIVPDPREKGKTPAQFKIKKKEIMRFLENREIQEKKEIKEKQKHVIEILLNENLINKDIMPLINEMIENENNLLISALEIFSVTKDHWDFCETLDLIFAIFKNNKEGGSEKKSMDSSIDKQTSNVSAMNSGKNMNQTDLTLTQLLNLFLNTKTKFSEKQKEFIRGKLKAKDPFLLPCLELYHDNGDEEELFESLEMLIKKMK